MTLKGHIPPNFMDLTGKKYGKLTVISRSKNSNSGLTKWLCYCECGNEKIVMSSSLKSGDTRSCGCLFLSLLRKRLTIHGGSNTSEFSTWGLIKYRCNNKNSPDWKDYGGRGITVCSRWLNSFENFLEDMGNKPSKKHSIDRIDNNGNYDPSNCRWSTIIEQANNKRNNIFIKYNGEPKSALELSKIIGIRPDTILCRVRYGWSDSDIINTPLKPKQKGKKNE